MKEFWSIFKQNFETKCEVLVEHFKHMVKCVAVFRFYFEYLMTQGRNKTPKQTHEVFRSLSGQFLKKIVEVEVGKFLKTFRARGSFSSYLDNTNFDKPKV